MNASSSAKRVLARILPAIVVAVLLVVAMFAPSRGAGGKPAQMESSADACGYVLEDCGNDGAWNVNPGAGITQPFGPIGGNIASCFLNFAQPPYAFGGAHCDLVQWDLAGLVPDPTTVALRTGDFPLSDLSYNHLTVYYFPPIVNRCVPGLADPPGSTLAVDFNIDGYSATGMSLNIAFNSFAPIPSLLQYTIGGARTPVATPHPVAAHTVCGSNDAIQSLYLVQSVMTANAPLDTTTDAVMQRFRVRVATTLKWVEVALQLGDVTGSSNTGLVEIYDGEGAGNVPPPLLRPLASAPLDPVPAYRRPSWTSHYDFSTSPMLQPDHDYWLYCESGHSWQLRTRMRTAAESPYFQQNIGPCYRTTRDPNWQPLSDRTLSFRVIGQPLTTLEARIPPRAGSSLKLSAAPNPSRGDVTLRWNGAAGTMWFDVLDPRGRRVARGEGAGGGSGQWRWRGLDESGRALPAGVYFVRATDDAGRIATQRVVLIR